MTSFKIGDTVIATTDITRVNGLSTLKKGHRAKITNVFQKSIDHPQIVDIAVDYGLPIRDIVCYDLYPLAKKKIKRLEGIQE